MELTRKLMLAGLGALALTRKKVEEIVDELVREGEVSEKERGRVVSEIADSITRFQDKFREMVGEELRKVIKATNLATKDDIDKLSERIDRLSNRPDK